jgi:hypothetical protein
MLPLSVHVHNCWSIIVIENRCDLQEWYVRLEALVVIFFNVHVFECSLHVDVNFLHNKMIAIIK